MKKLKYLTYLSSILKSSSNKQTDFIDKIFPILKHILLNFLENVTSDYDEKNNLTENSLNLLETYINKILSSLEKNSY